MVKRKKQQGFVTAVAASVGVAILVFFTGIYYILQHGMRENMVIDLRDQSSAMAEAGVQDAIHIIRVNPDLSQLDLTMHDPENPSDSLASSTDGPAHHPDANGAAEDGFFGIYHKQYPRFVRDSAQKTIGKYFIKASKIHDVDADPWKNGQKHIFRDEANPSILIEGTVFHIVSEGWSINRRGEEQSRSTTHAFVYLANVGEYFGAVKGHLKVAKGAKLGAATVYGRSLEFDLSGGVDSIHINRADYFTVYQPDIWPDSPDDFGYRRVKINTNSNLVPPVEPGYYLPSRLNAPLVFPSINEQLTFYSNTLTSIHVSRVAGCAFGGPSQITLEPPSVMANGWASGYSSTNNNKDHAYYCGDPDGTTIGNVNIRGQVILASQGKVKITGNITIPDGGVADTLKSASAGNYDPPDDNTPDGNVPSKADQLVIYAEQGFEISGNWCNITGNTLKLQGVLLISPDATITYDTSSPCVTPASYSLDFLGAMFLADQPDLGTRFTDQTPPPPFPPESPRQYRYLETLKTDPPPIREFYQVLKQFTLRRGS